MKHKSKILLVEDDPTLGYLLNEYLTLNEFKVSLKSNAKEALELLNSDFFDLAILDIMLPDIDGFNLAKIIHQQHPNVPFIFLTARSLKVDVLKGFSLGAVDYLKKPIDEEELVIRIKTLLQRLQPTTNITNNEDFIYLGKYKFNITNQQLIFNQNTKTLTKRETELLALLLSYKNNICTHKKILVTIWGKNDYFHKKSMNVFITRLRKYLDQDPDVKIENIHQQGFILHTP